MLRSLARSRARMALMAEHAARIATSSAGAAEPTASFGYEDVPESEKAARVGRVFEGVAPNYDLMNDLMSAGLHRLWKDTFVGRLQAFPGMQHLDVAGGTGDVALRVRQCIDTACRDAAQHADDPVLQERGRVVVCDVNAAMLEAGRRKHSGAALEWVLGDAEALPFPSASFDSYSIAFGIRNVTRIPAALREAHRVLRPGGHFACLEFSHVALPGLKQLYDAYSMHVIPEIGRAVAGNRESYQYLVESIRRFPRQEAFLGMLREAGFRNAGFENLTGGVVAIHSGFKA